MRRTFEHGTRARLYFSGGPHAPVNMVDSVENAGTSTVSGSKEAMEVPKKFKDPACFTTSIHFFHIIRHVYRNVTRQRS